MGNAKKIISFTVFGLMTGFAGLVNADQIVLQDGSIINGEVISLQAGDYKIRTGSLGVITLNQQKVKSITQGSGSQTKDKQSVAGVSPSALQSLQSSISSDPGMMANILQLQSDPDMQAVLNDPELMRAIQSFDLEALRNNPKIQKLMRNSTVQGIQGKVN